LPPSGVPGLINIEKREEKVMTQHMGSAEILLIADAVAREKGIPKDSVLAALEDAVRVAARRKYGHENTINAHIDRRSGEIRVFREMRVVDDVQPASQEHAVKEGGEEEMTTISLSEARNFYKKDAEVGEVLQEALPALDLGRVAAQSAKQVITQKVREIERDKNYQEFKDRVGKIISAVVDQVERDCVRVKVGSTEAIMYNADIPFEEKKRLKHGDRIRALVYEVTKEGKGAQIRLSRAHEEFVVELFRQEVTEIYDGVIQVKLVARDPGFRTKIAVFSPEFGVDAVGSCVGLRGARVQAVINELGGEKIDVIQWSPDMATTVVNALSPAEVGKVIIDENNNRVEVVVPDEQLNIAIGRRGQNVRLASKLIGWDIDVLSEDAESKRRAEEFANATKHLMSALDVEEILAQLLASEGYMHARDIVGVAASELAAIDGLDVEIAEELISRAQEYLAANPTSVAPRAVGLKIDRKIMMLPEMNQEIALALVAGGVKSLQDLADLSSDEFMELLPEGLQASLERSKIDAMIMAARNRVYFNQKT
jgi:N utilization substance protein A